jgi:hypothetical protein
MISTDAARNGARWLLRKVNQVVYRGAPAMRWGNFFIADDARKADASKNTSKSEQQKKRSPTIVEYVSQQ